MSQSPEERTAFKRDFKILCKAKRAICETINLEGSQVAINKNYKKIYFVNDPEIRIIVELSLAKSHAMTGYDS